MQKRLGRRAPRDTKERARSVLRWRAHRCATFYRRSVIYSLIFRPTLCLPRALLLMCRVLCTQRRCQACMWNLPSQVRFLYMSLPGRHILMARRRVNKSTSVCCSACNPRHTKNHSAHSQSISPGFSGRDTTLKNRMGPYTILGHEQYCTASDL